MLLSTKYDPSRSCRRIGCGKPSEYAIGYRDPNRLPMEPGVYDPTTLWMTYLCKECTTDFLRKAGPEGDNDSVRSIHFLGGLTVGEE